MTPPEPTGAHLRLRALIERSLYRLRTRPVIVAVSAGADSVALFYLMKETLGDRAAAELVVAHLHHGLRGAAADADEAFVAALARAAGCHFAAARADVAARAADGKLSIEEAGRLARREFLTGISRDRGHAPVALAHTRDDQAETLLHNLLRGAGPRGLAAMPLVGPAPFFRPLLRARRAELRGYLRERGLEWREDETNADPRFTRNRIRSDVLPLLEKALNPRAVDVLLRAAGIQREVAEWLHRQAVAVLEEAGVDIEAAPPIGLSRSKLIALPTPVRHEVLRELGRRFGGPARSWSRRTIRSVMGPEFLKRATGAGRAAVELPGGWRVELRGDRLTVDRAGAAPDAHRPGATPPIRPAEVELPLTHGSEARWGAGTIRVTRLELSRAMLESARRPGSPWTALFESESLPERLLVRARRPGDRIRPIGLEGHRRLQDVLVDARVPAAARSRAPLVAAPDPGSELLWVPGVIRSGRALVTDETRRVVLLEWFGPRPW